MFERKYLFQLNLKFISLSSDLLSPNIFKICEKATVKTLDTANSR
jgi:hypothetical protein